MWRVVIYGAALLCLMPFLAEAHSDDRHVITGEHPLDRAPQQQMGDTGEVLDLKLQALSQRLDTQDKRLDTQNDHLEHSLNLVGLLVAGLGLVLSVAGIVTYTTVRNRAVREAQVVAQDWLVHQTEDITNKCDELAIRVDELFKKAEESRGRILAAEDGVQDHANRARRAIESITLGIQTAGRDHADLSPESSADLVAAVNALRDKPEADYTFDDWNTRAYAAYLADDLDRAAEYWRGGLVKRCVNKDQAASFFVAGTAVWGSLIGCPSA